MIVADTNLISYLYIEGAHSPLARQVVLRDPDWVAPFLWRSELRSILIKGLRSGLLERIEAFRIMATAESMMSGWEYDVASDDVLELAAKARCSAYDAEFLVLARYLKAPLITKDKELTDKFPGTALAPEEFLAR
jgi:predicted nucleic acid-binding protein